MDSNNKEKIENELIEIRNLFDGAMLDLGEKVIISDDKQEQEICEDSICVICSAPIVELYGAYKFGDYWVCTEKCANQIQKRKMINFKS